MVIPVFQRGRLPHVADRLIGRTSEVAAAMKLVGSGSLVTLVGPGGVGKTRLAIELGAGLADRWADGVWFVALAPVATADRVPSAVADVLGVQESAGRTLIDSVINAACHAPADADRRQLRARATWRSGADRGAHAAGVRPSPSWPPAESRWPCRVNGSSPSHHWRCRTAIERWKRHRPSSSSSSGLKRPILRSWSPTMRCTASGTSAAASTACHWRSSSRPPGSVGSASTDSPTCSTTDSRSCIVPATTTRVTTPCGRPCDGPMTCSTSASARCSVAAGLRWRVPARRSRGGARVRRARWLGRGRRSRQSRGQVDAPDRGAVARPRAPHAGDVAAVRCGALGRRDEARAAPQVRGAPR